MIPNVNDIIDYEEGNLDHESAAKMMQGMINSGMAWQMQGSYGRAAMAALESGDCMLGEVGHRDFWGSYVPSRSEVKAGTKGSRALVVEAHGEEYAAMLESVS